MEESGCGVKFFIFGSNKKTMWNKAIRNFKVNKDVPNLGHSPRDIEREISRDYICVCDYKINLQWFYVD